MSGIGGIGGIGAMGGAGMGSGGLSAGGGLSGAELGGLGAQGGFGGQGLLPAHGAGHGLCAGPSTVVNISGAGNEMGMAAGQLSEALIALMLLKLMEQAAGGQA